MDADGSGVISVQFYGTGVMTAESGAGERRTENRAWDRKNLIEMEVYFKTIHVPS